MALQKRISRHHKRRGVALIWVVITFLVIFAFGGLMLDWARVYLAGHQLQNAADASALAGARYVAWDPAADKTAARTEARNYAQANQAAQAPVNLLLNTGNTPEGDIVIGRYITQSLEFIPTTSTPNAMKTVSRKDGTSNERLGLLFGPLFGVAERDNIQKYAIAKIYNASGAAVIALSDDETGVYLHGTPSLTIENGGTVYANSVDIDSVLLAGTPDPEVAEINIVGDLSINGGFDTTTDLTYDGMPGSVNTGVDPIDDPLGDLDEPSYAGLPDMGTIDDAGTLASPEVYSPGYYSGGIEKPDSGYITLLPGIYHLDGTKNKGGINITNDQCTIVAEGVMFHIVGTDASVNITGSNLTLSPPTSGDYAGISIFQSRSNTNDAFIAGNGGLDMTGILYFPENFLEVLGNGDTIGTQLIADTIEIGGTGDILIPYNGTPEISQKSYLVE